MKCRFSLSAGQTRSDRAKASPGERSRRPAAIAGVRDSARAAVLRVSAIAGFTLVELLVVIAIIAILIALLLPALAAARLLADNVVSSSNLQQIGMGMMEYANDYSGFLPPANDTLNLGENGSGWITLLATGSEKPHYNQVSSPAGHGSGIFPDAYVPTTFEQNANRTGVFFDPTDRSTWTTTEMAAPYQLPGFSSYKAIDIMGWLWKNTQVGYVGLNSNQIPNDNQPFYGARPGMVVPIVALDIWPNWSGQIVVPWDNGFTYPPTNAPLTNGVREDLFNSTPYANGKRPLLFSDFSVESMGFMAFNDPRDIGTNQYRFHFPRGH